MIFYRLKSGKIFNLKEEEYVTYSELASYVRNNLNFKLIDATSDEDITHSVEKDFSSDSELIAIDLFCGAGGLSFGLEMAGFKLILGVDVDKNALKTYKKNHSAAKVFHGPIEDISFEYLDSVLKGRKLHLLAGGPPCQGFSTIGKGDPKDKKNKLFKHYCRILEYLKPDFFIFENVTGILAKKNKPVLDAILKEFKRIGYNLKVSVLEAQKYGVPQKRKRAILMGSRLDINFNFPLATHDTNIGDKYIPAKTVGEALLEISSTEKKAYSEKPSGNKLPDLLRRRLSCIPEGRGIRYKRDEDELLPNELKLDVDWENIREGRLRELHYYRFDRSKPAPTIQTQCFHYFHPVELRHFSPRELASFQSFPSKFEFIGARTSQIKQIGNAVPPLLGKALGEAIIDAYRFKEEKINSFEIDDTIKHAFNYDNYNGLRTKLNKKTY
jgi:DNA (cytosine-5)-methyltransferase 1